MSSFTAPLATLDLTEEQRRQIQRELDIPDKELYLYKRIIRQYRYWLDELHDDGPYITVPYLFVTDGASIPKFLWSWIGSPWTGGYVQAAVLHDLLFRACGWVVHHCKRLSSKYEYDVVIPVSSNTYIVKYTFGSCNRILYDASAVLGTPTWKRNVMYWGIYLKGEPYWWFWHNYWKLKKQQHPLFMVNTRPELADVKEEWLADSRPVSDDDAFEEDLGGE